MAVATARCVALAGAVGHLVDVQADVSSGQVGTTLVGRVDSALNEGRDRVRMAIENSLLTWPGSTKRVTVLLAPAALPKSGAHFDLAIAVAILAATGELDPRSLEETAFIGELALDGGLRSVTGVLPMVLAASQRGIRCVFVPEPQAREAALVPDMTVLGLRSLRQVVAALTDSEMPEAPPVPPISGSGFLSWRGAARLEEVDMADLVGLEDVKYAAEVAAAGGHHLLLDGPKGSCIPSAHLWVLYFFHEHSEDHPLRPVRPAVKGLRHFGLNRAPDRVGRAVRRCPRLAGRRGVPRQRS